MKKIVVISIIVILGLVAGIGVYEYIRGKNLDKAVAALKDEVSGLKDQGKQDASKIEGLNQVLKTEQEARKRVDAENDQLHYQNANLIVERDEYKKQIQQMTDVQLADEMRERLGSDEVGVVLSGKFHFSLTRTGGEKTVSIFKDAETFFSLAENRAEEIENLNDKVGSLENSLAIEGVKTTTEHEGRVRAETTLDKAMKQLDVMVGAKKLARWLGRAEGAGVATIVYLIIKAVSK